MAGIPLLATAAAGASLLQGFTANQAAKQEASLMDQQAQLAQQEASAEADRRATEARKFLAQQKLAYIKNGVRLTGSPLDVLDETISESQKDVNSVVSSGNARANLYSAKAAQTRNAGRSALIGGFGNAFSNYSKLKDL